MKRLSLLLLGAGLLLACRKDDLLFVASNTSTLATALLPGAPATQVFRFALNQPQSLRTAAGATLSFLASDFILPNGNVATGQAEMRVRELYTVADMVLANMPTTTYNGAHLVSGGEFVIQVWQGTTRLRLAPISATGVVQRLTLTSPVPTSGLDTTPMLLWQLPAQAFAATAPDSSGWLPVSSGLANSSPAVVTSNGGFYSASLPLDSIGNWNIDQFWHAYASYNVGGAYVEVPAGANETQVYFRPVGYNGLARCVATATLNRWASNLPLGSDVVAVVLQARNGQLYYGTQRVTVQSGMVITPALQALSASDIVQRIRQL